MGREGYRERVAAAHAFRHAQGGGEVHVEAAELLRHAHAEQAELAGFLHQAAHEAFLLVVEALEQGPHLGLHEVDARLVHHVLLLGKVGRGEDALGIGRLDDEFAALQAGLLRYFHDGLGWGVELKSVRLAYYLEKQ